MESLKYSEILKQNVFLAKSVENITPYKIKVLANFTCNQLKDILEFNLRKSKLNPETEIGNWLPIFIGLSGTDIFMIDLLDC